MKLYLSSNQTAKLIELGFEKPKGWYGEGITNDIKLYVNIDANPMMFNYSIGELIEMLPTYKNLGNKCWSLTIAWSQLNKGWIVGGSRDPQDYTYGSELIDALYDMCVKLKEKEII